jgi:hypothetical protein
MNIDTVIIHITAIIICSIALGFLIQSLRILRKTQVWIVPIIIMLITLLVNINLFSTVYIIDKFDNVILDVYFYNMWSLFIRIHASVNILWSSYIILRRIRSENE